MPLMSAGASGRSDVAVTMTARVTSNGMGQLMGKE